MMQDFDSESFKSGDSHSQKVKGSPLLNDSGSKDCVRLPSPTAVSRLKGLRFSSLDYSLTEKLDSRPLYAVASLAHESQKEALDYLCV